MTRIAVIGNCCSGKSVLGRQLAQRSRLPYFELDRFLLQPNWQLLELEPFMREHDRLTSWGRWLIEGLGLPHTLAHRLERATDIILIDLPLSLLLERAAQRQEAWEAGTLKHPPGGLQQPPPAHETFQLMRDIDAGWMPQIRALCAAQEGGGKRVTRLTSLAALVEFGAAALSSVPGKSEA